MSKQSFKSLENFIRSLIDSFEYDDFSPIFNRDKFIEVINVETPYWKPYDTEDTIPGWHVLLEVKSYKTWQSTKIAIKLRPELIHIAVYNHYSELAAAQYYAKEIPPKDVWMDHETLYVFLCEIFQTALNHANRENGGVDTLKSTRRSWPTDL